MATQRNLGGGSRPGAGTRGRQSGDASQPETQEATRRAGDEPDVLLDVPRLAVEEIALEVDNLHARIALEARLADLVHLHVGADARIERVALEIKGVEAQAQLKVRLEKVLAIIERALDTVDKNPEILTELARSAQGVAGEVGEGVSRVGEEAGQVVEGTAEVDEAAGQLEESAAKATGSSSGGRGGRSRGDGGEPDSASKRRRASSSRK